MRNDPPDLNGRSESNGIDALIDDAARRLVAGEPSSSLRTGVRDRIGRRRPGWMLVPAWGAAIAIVIAAVLAGRMILDRPGDRDGDPQNNRSAAIHVPAIQPQASDVPPETAPRAAIQPARTEARQLSRRLADAITSPPAEEESLIPPLAIEPLATTPLREVQIAVDTSSGVTPIEIEPLQIEPLLGQ